MDQENTNPNVQRTIKGRIYIGVVILIGAVIFLIVTATRSATQYYLTIDEILLTWEEVPERTYRVSGVVDGETIVYDPASALLTFTIASIPADMDEVERMGGLGAVLNQAVNDPQAQRLQVEYVGSQPDLLGHAVQAIVTGRMQLNGVFQAEELLLKCPSRYEPQLSEVSP